MLKNWTFGTDKRTSSECKELLRIRREDLAAIQQNIKAARLPIIILVEGWGAAGKGSIIRSLIKELDPRFFKVLSVGSPSEEDSRWPFLKRHFQNIPEAGKITFLDSGWMDEIVREYLRGDLSDDEYHRRLESVRIFERQLVDGGYLIVKLFIHIDAEQQRERLDHLAADRETAWRSVQMTVVRTKTMTKLLLCLTIT